LKYWVALSGPPVRMPFASCTVIFFAASMSRGFAFGTAASAARFMRRTRSSACLPAPIECIIASARFIDGGSGILMRESLMNPSCLPSLATAACAPLVSAVFSPLIASRLLMSSIPAAEADETTSAARNPDARIKRPP